MLETNLVIDSHIDSQIAKTIKNVNLGQKISSTFTYATSKLKIDTKITTGLII